MTGTVASAYWVLGVSLMLSASMASGAETSQTVRLEDIPKANHVPLDLTEIATPEIRTASAELYNYVRSRLIAAEIDYPIAIDVLSSVTTQGNNNFAIPGARYAAWSTRRPSALALLCWRDDLLTIASEAERRFIKTTSSRGASAASDDDVLVDMPDPGNRLTTRIPTALRRALAGLGDLRMNCPGARPVFLPGPLKWRHAVRIESTGAINTDARIAAALTQIKRHVPNAPIDSKSFPARRGTGNLHFGTSGSNEFRYSLGKFLHNCLERSECLDLGQSIAAPIASPRTKPLISSREFLANAYFSRPYHISFSRPMAFVQIAKNSGITGAICGFDDQEAGDSRETTNVTSCLLQALGAYPTDELDANGYDDGHEKRLIEIELDQLTQLYKK